MHIYGCELKLRDRSQPLLSVLFCSEGCVHAFVVLVLSSSFIALSALLAHELHGGQGVLTRAPVIYGLHCMCMSCTVGGSWHEVEAAIALL